MPDYAIMNQFLYEGKAPKVEELTKAALAEGRDVEEVLQEGLIAAMSVVGEDFKRNRIYVPQVLIAARAMKAGMAVLKPLLIKEGGGDFNCHDCHGDGQGGFARYWQESGVYDGRGRWV